MNNRESDQDTIAAIATAPGEGGIGIIRLSGREAIVIASKIFKPLNGGDVLAQRGFSARFGHVVSRRSASGGDQIVDEAILLVMRAPKSYTTEDVAEIQIHGGSAVLQQVLALAVREGARLAGHGEFTKRAFLNGRIDLLQAEAVLDLIQARAEKSLQWAGAQLEGSLSRKMLKMKSLLIDTLSPLEASVDFPEDNLETGGQSLIQQKLKEAQSQVRILLDGSELGILAKRGVRAAFWGRPNTGKSSLMNCLVRHNRVIVTPIPGTTRDVVEEEIQIKGFPVRILDTAGIQATLDLIEVEGVERSRKAMMDAGIVLFVLDSSQPLSEEDRKLYQEIKGKPKIIILNKSDISSKAVNLESLDSRANAISTSCQTGEGIAALENEIFRLMTDGQADLTDDNAVTSVRQKDVLKKMHAAITDALNACDAGLSAEFIAVDVRLALAHLGELVGEITNDEVLEVLFSQFCIGK